MKPLVPALVAVLFAGSTAIAAAAPSAADAIKARQANYKKLGAAFKGIHDQLQSGAPDKAVIKRDADEIAALAPHVNEWFAPGTGPQAGVKTAAKAEIWTNQAEFRKDAQVFAAEAAKLSQVAAGGDTAAIESQFKATGQACGACHKAFRQKDHD